MNDKRRNRIGIIAKILIVCVIAFIAIGQGRLALADKKAKKFAEDTGISTTYSRDFSKNAAMTTALYASCTSSPAGKTEHPKALMKRLVLTHIKAQRRARYLTRLPRMKASAITLW